MAVMNAIEFDASASTLTLVRTRVEKVPENCLLLDIAYSGICGTDLHIIQGHFPCAPKVILGHEFSGFVKEVGRGVDDFKIGDKVTVDPNRGCYSCGFCRRGEYNVCKEEGINGTIGIHRNGGWAEYCAVPKRLVHKVPKDSDLATAVLCEPLSCVIHGLNRISPIQVGTRILITGAGIVGILWACVLHHLGHRYVVVSEISEKRRQILENLDLGFTVVHPNDLKKLSEEEENLSFGLYIDCSGNAKVVEDGISLMDQGGKVCIFGIASPEAILRVSPYTLYKKEITIYGVLINRYTLGAACDLMRVMENRYLSFSKLGIQTFQLSEFDSALEQLKSASITKAVFDLKQQMKHEETNGEVNGNL